MTMYVHTCIHILVVSEAPKTKSAVKARIAASMALIFGTETGLVEVKMFNEMKTDAGSVHSLKGLGDNRSLYVHNNDHANHRPKDPEHRTVEFMCGGDWQISHGGPRMSAGRQGPVQVLTAAIKAGTPEFQCKTYEEYERLLEAAADSVGYTKSALPRVFSKASGFGTASKRVQGDLIRNPAYDEEEFKALPKEQQTRQQERSMKYLQGPNGSLRETRMVAHEF